MPTSGKPPLILASASPRRLDLLAQIGIVPDRVAPSAIGEAALKGELPPQLARRLAEAKALDVAANFPNSLVLGADTVVACGRRVLPKTDDEAAARRCLSLLSGRRHRVYGGICLIDPAGKSHLRLATTAVAVKRLNEKEIEGYIAAGEWRDKAGAYAIQGLFSRYVRQISGSYSNVVGLCLYQTAALLRGLGHE